MFRNQVNREEIGHSLHIGIANILDQTLYSFQALCDERLQTSESGSVQRCDTLPLSRAAAGKDPTGLPGPA